MADSTSSPAPTCDVDGTCYCPLTGVIDTLSQKYAMQLKRLDEFEGCRTDLSNSIQ